MSKPTIVVIAYNREKSIQRLLKSLASASYPSAEVTLHISIDASNNSKVKEIADNFHWKFGEKVVDIKNENLGLVKHVMECGELTEKYETIIVLEDDLVVAPGFYQYAEATNKFFTEDDRIAGVSLFTYPIEENNSYPFQPIQDGTDVHFIQVASSWGQSWNKAQWSRFKSWLIDNPNGKESMLPQYILDWGNNSWKKLFINYMIDTDRYFVFPNRSYTTNFEDEGTNSSQTGLFQVPMNFGVMNPRLVPLNDSNSVYDVYFELTPKALKRLVPGFSDFDVEVDLYGNKPLEKIDKEYILTIRNGIKSQRSFGATMQPIIQNVIFDNNGDVISLLKKEDIFEFEETDRFLKVSEAIEKQRMYTNAFTPIKKRVTIVIPSVDKEQLQYTFDQCYKDRFHNVTLLICCDPDISEHFKMIEKSIGCHIKWIESKSKNLNELLRIGFNAVESDYMSWVQAGMEIDLKSFEKVSKVFSGMKQVNFLRGIDEEITKDNYLKKSSASWRMTPQLAYLYTNRSRTITSELMVWRSSILDEVKHELNEDFSNLFVALLKATPLYVFMENVGLTKGIKSIHPLSKVELRKSLSDQKFRRSPFQRFISHPFFFPGFYCNIPFIRFFYKEIARFPLVIRYDYRNDSYFLDNY